MRKEILYTSALNNGGDLIHIDKAEKGNAYYCPSCKGEFILRQSGNTGKGSKRPHFAHNELSQNCTAESVLHLSFKKKLYNLLEDHLSEKKELTIRWSCSDCSEHQAGNLLAITTSVREEHNLKVCQPDIALLDANDNVIAAIEIVVTHSPEEEVLQFYRDNGITLIQIDLSSDEDLENIEKLISSPSIVDICFNPTCSNNNRYSIVRNIVAYAGRCGRCHSPIERYAVEIISAFGKWRTFNFTDDEIHLVKYNRNNIKVLTDSSKNEKYPASTCNNCKRLRAKYNRSRRF